jgi:hypothetical protein
MFNFRLQFADDDRNTFFNNTCFFNGNFFEGISERELLPRGVNESVEAGRVWSESLEPEIRRRLEDGVRGTEIRF